VSGIDDAIRTTVRDAVTDGLRPALDELRALRQQLATASQPSSADDVYVSCARAAEIVSVSACTIRRWVSSGKLHAHRAGRRVRIRLADLRAFLARTPEPVVDDPDALAARILARRRPRGR
jgi:excisionase family DNA binding protein